MQPGQWAAFFVLVEGGGPALDGVGRSIPRKEERREGEWRGWSVGREGGKEREEIVAPLSSFQNHAPPLLSPPNSFPRIRTCINAALAVGVPLAAMRDRLVHHEVADRTLQFVVDGVDEEGVDTHRSGLTWECRSRSVGWAVVDRGRGGTGSERCGGLNEVHCVRGEQAA